MGLRISSNIQSLEAQRSLHQNYEAGERSLEKISSGSRINRAADDASGLSISENLRANVRSLNQAIREAQSGISIAQVAEGALHEINNNLIRIRELSVQSASDTLSDNERSMTNQEVQVLKNEIDRIANATEYNGSKLLNGIAKEFEIQVGVHNRPSEDRLVFDTTNLVQSTHALGVYDVSTASKATARENLFKIDYAIDEVNESRASLGAFQNRLEAALQDMRIYSENLGAAKGRVSDADIGEETAELTRQNIMLQSNVSVLGQANTTPTKALQLLKQE